MCKQKEGEMICVCSVADQEENVILLRYPVHFVYRSRSKTHIRCCFTKPFKSGANKGAFLCMHVDVYNIYTCIFATDHVWLTILWGYNRCPKEEMEYNYRNTVRIEVPTQHRRFRACRVPYLHEESEAQQVYFRAIMITKNYHIVNDAFTALRLTSTPTHPYNILLVSLSMQWRTSCKNNTYVLYITNSK